MDLDVSHIILKHWGLKSAPRPETSGGSRATWQLENGHWLSRCGVDDAEPFRAEGRLLGRLRDVLVAQQSMLKVPEIVHDLHGSESVTDGGYVWRMTRNIAGSKLPASDLRTYPVLIDVLDGLHSALKHIPLPCAPVKTGVVEAVKAHCKKTVEAPVVAEALAWLEPRLERLAVLPRTVTHGDFNPTNVLYTEGGDHLAVAGVIDFELSRPDPTVMDYSQLLTMLVCHSGVSNLTEEASLLLARLQGRFTQEQMGVAMVAYWADLYFRWQDASPIAEAKIRLRLGQVMGFVTGL